MSFAPLTSCLNSEFNLKETTKAKVKLGSVWKDSGESFKKHKYWKKFFNKHKPGSIVTLKEMLAYPNLNDPEWMVMYKKGKGLSFDKENDQSTLVLVHCDFGLIEIIKKGKKDYIRPDYLYLEVITESK